MLLEDGERLAYVAILGGGIAVADVNAVYLEADDPTPQVQVRGVFSGRSTMCALPPSDPLFLDVGGLFDPTDAHPLTVAGLLAERGVSLIESNPNDVGQLTAYNEVCAQIGNSRRVLGLEVAQRYRFDFDGDGLLEESEERDYLLLAHIQAGLLVFDATDRENVTLVGRIRVPGSAVDVALDRDGRRLYAAGSAAGVYVVDFDRLPAIELLDANGDGEDDRVLETIVLAGNTNATPFVIPELGLAFAGGADRPLTGLLVGSPRLATVTSNPDGGLRAITVVAGVGVTTAPEGTAPGTPDLPASFQVLAWLPGSAGPEIRVNVESLGPGGVVIDGAGDPSALPALPPPALTGSDALVLRRQSDDPRHDGYNLYLSDPVAALADLRAARAFARTAAEDDACTRCDQEALGVPATARELLSGDTIAVRFTDSARTALADVYTAAKLDAAELSLASTRWETAPALRQEPTLNADTGMGEVAPGTLLHSGEQSAEAVDLAIRGRGFDFVFRRTYRNQGVGSGPLGPGWDHTYRRRLRELPNGDVEYYDGRGRREIFRATGAPGAGTYESPPGRFATLERTAAGFVLVHPDFTRVRFDRFGRLTSIADPVRENDATGNLMTFHYDAASRLVRVRDTLGRDVTLTYNPAGLLTELTDFTGRTVRYSYDPSGRLETVTSPAVTTGEATFPDGLTTTYAYATPAGDLAGRLTSRDNLVAFTDPRGITWLGVAYTDADGDGRAEEVTSQTWGEGSLAIAYDFNNRTTTVTDRRGNPHVCRHNAAGQKTRYEDPVGATWLYSYDDEGLRTSMTEPLGRVTTWAYDAPCGGAAPTGLRRSRGEPTEIRVTADSRGANGSSDTLVTCIEYETRTNQPVRIVDPRGAVTEIDRNAVGLPTAVREAVGAPEAWATQFAYNAFGQLTELTNPNGHLTAYSYFETGPSKGYLQREVIDPGGLAITTTQETDARGNVTAVTNPRGVRHERRFNEVDWLIEETRAASPATDGAPALNYRTVYLRDRNGNLVELRRPFGDTGAETTSEFYEYGSLNERLEVRREVGDGTVAVDTYEHDPNLNVIRHTAPEGQVTETVHDPRDLIASVTRGAGTADAVTESFTYDLERQLTARTDGRGNTWSTSYDGYGRPAERRDPLGNRTTTSFDDQGNPTRVESFDGATGELLAETVFTHDLLARRTTTTEKLWREPGDMRDVISRTVFDPAGNVTASIDPLGRQISYTFDAAERLVSMTDPAGNRTLLQLDPAGNPTATTEVEQTPEGGEVSVVATATFDAADRPASMTDPLGNTDRRLYDARDNLRYSIDPENFATERRYDGLDRRVATLQPEGVDIAYTYDLSSRPTAYRDALGNTTTYTWDALDRQRSVTYPDGTIRLVSYDPSHNIDQIEDANGTVIVQTHDPANRLSARQVTPGEGVAGATAESFAWDGLDRLVRAQKGDAVTDLAYDSLSRQIRDALRGREVGSLHDDANNPVATAYPSAADTIGRVFDPLDRPARIGPRLADGTVTEASGYAFRGKDLVAQQSYGNGIAGERTFDAARRPLTDVRSTPSFPVPVFSESLAWSPRSLKVAQSRGDLGGAGFALAHDGLKRLLEAARPPEPTASVPNNSTPAPGTLAALPDAFAYSYDRAQNLTQRRTRDEGIAEAIALPPDASGRNRPASINGIPLAYDANGNLIQKGDLRIEYDWRNLPVRVSDSTGEIARYEYDAFNRRIATHAGGQLRETVWDGWQEIEHLVDGQLVSRNIYGLGLDEIVRIDRDTDGDGTLDQQLTPLYDSTGNLAVVTDQNGKPVERYAYSPFGERTITVDLTPPRIVQVRVVGGAVWIEVSEEVRLDGLIAAAGEGSLALTDTASGEPIAISITQPVETGRLKRRRSVLTPTEVPAEGTEVRLRIEPSALLDLFLNEASEPFEETFAWPAGDILVFDGAPPDLVQVAVKDGLLEVQLSEEIEPSALAAGLRLDNQAVAWSTAEDRYTLRTDEPVGDGAHALVLTTALADLAGSSVASGRTFDFTVPAANPNLFVFRTAEPGVVGSSTVGNQFGFHGRPVDPETGFVYMRNRYLDPELGRFITPDPLGAADGPSLYQFAANSPYDYGDPLGLKRIELEADSRKARRIQRRYRKAYELFKRSPAGQEAARKLEEAEDYTLFIKYDPEYNERDQGLVVGDYVFSEQGELVSATLRVGPRWESEIGSEEYYPFGSSLTKKRERRVYTVGHEEQGHFMLAVEDDQYLARLKRKEEYNRRAEALYAEVKRLFPDDDQATEMVQELARRQREAGLPRERDEALQTKILHEQLADERGKQYVLEFRRARGRQGSAVE